MGGGVKVQNDLENLLAQLKDRPLSTLTGLETRVWAEIGGRARAPAANLWGWRSAASALVLALGILTQAAASAHTAPELALFTPRSAIAPSTLLGEDR
jgi:hypothetical protein